MSRHNIFRNITTRLLQNFFSVPEKKTEKLKSAQKILIVRQHNQFGDLLASVSLFRAVKETFPTSKLFLVVSPENFFAVEKNEFVDQLFVFDKRKFFSLSYLISMYKFLKGNYDLAIVPATVAISKTSCLLAALSDAKNKVGPNSLGENQNKLNFVFNYRIDLNWEKCPDAHVSDFIQDVVRPLGIKTRDFKSSIKFDADDEEHADTFLNDLKSKEGMKVIGFHIGAGKPQNRWPLEKYIKLIYLLENEFQLKIYFTGSNADKEEINYIQSNLNIEAGYFLNKTIPQVAALISKSDLFITNDTGVMHVAGTTDTPQISIFGPTNPFNWAPVGKEKYFLRRSEFVSDVPEEDVLTLAKYIFEKR